MYHVWKLHDNYVQWRSSIKARHGKLMKLCKVSNIRSQSWYFQICLWYWVFFEIVYKMSVYKIQKELQYSVLDTDIVSSLPGENNWNFRIEISNFPSHNTKWKMDISLQVFSFWYTIQGQVDLLFEIFWTKILEKGE